MGEQVDDQAAGDGGEAPAPARPRRRVVVPVVLVVLALIVAGTALRLRSDGGGGEDTTSAAREGVENLVADPAAADAVPPVEQLLALQGSLGDPVRQLEAEFDDCTKVETWTPEQTTTGLYVIEAYGAAGGNGGNTEGGKGGKGGAARLLIPARSLAEQLRGRPVQIAPGCIGQNGGTYPQDDRLTVTRGSGGGGGASTIVVAEGGMASADACTPKAYRYPGDPCDVLLVAGGGGGGGGSTDGSWQGGAGGDGATTNPTGASAPRLDHVGLVKAEGGGGGGSLAGPTGGLCGQVRSARTPDASVCLGDRTVGQKTLGGNGVGGVGGSGGSAGSPGNSWPPGSLPGYEGDNALSVGPGNGGQGTGGYGPRVNDHPGQAGLNLKSGSGPGGGGGGYGGGGGGDNALIYGNVVEGAPEPMSSASGGGGGGSFVWNATSWAANPKPAGAEGYVRISYWGTAAVPAAVTTSGAVYQPAVGGRDDWGLVTAWGKIGQIPLAPTATGSLLDRYLAGGTVDGTPSLSTSGDEGWTWSAPVAIDGLTGAPIGIASGYRSTGGDGGPYTPTFTVVAAADGSTSRSTDGGTSWTRSTKTLGDLGGNPITALGTAGDGLHVYAIAGSKVWWTVDGDTWTKMAVQPFELRSADTILGINKDIGTIIFDPTIGQIWYSAGVDKPWSGTGPGVRRPIALAAPASPDMPWAPVVTLDGTTHDAASTVVDQGGFPRWATTSYLPAPAGTTAVGVKAHACGRLVFALGRRGSTIDAWVGNYGPGSWSPSIAGQFPSNGAFFMCPTRWDSQDFPY